MATFTWNSTSYNCVIAPIPKGRQYDGSGYYNNGASQLLVNTSNFTTRPQPNDIITIGTTDYKIDIVTPDEFDAALLINFSGINEA
jgi:hypothetical protein